MINDRQSLEWSILAVAIGSAHLLVGIFDSYVV